MRLILIASAVVAILAQAGVIYLGQASINSYSAQVAEAVATSSENDKTLQDLELVSAILERQEETVEKSDKLAVDGTDTYAYQNRIIDEISHYAAKAGLRTTGFTFTTDVGAAGAGTPAAGATPAPAAATPAAGGADATAGTVSPAPTGVTPVEVSVELAPGATYEQLYTFLKLTENSLMRIEVGSISLSSSAGGAAPADAAGAGGVGLTTLNVKVYKKP